MIKNYLFSYTNKHISVYSAKGDINFQIGSYIIFPKRKDRKCNKMVLLSLIRFSMTMKRTIKSIVRNTKILWKIFPSW